MRGDEGGVAVLADPGVVEGLLAAGAGVETLVPADVPGLLSVVPLLRAMAEILETAGRSLARVEVTGWRGAASVLFADRVAREPGRWQTAAESFRAGASALERYAEDVVAARAVAAAAVDVYRRYLQSVDSLLAGSGMAPLSGASAVGMRISRLQEAVTTAAGPADAAGGRRIAATAVAADGLRGQALGLMARARSQVDGAGDLAAQRLREAMAPAPEARRFWESTIRPADAIGVGHTTLDAIGLLPVVGEAADVANALWYLGENDLPNAGLSAAGVLPLVGTYVIIEKFGRKVLLRDGVLVGGRAAADILGFHALIRLADGGLAAHELDGVGHTIARHVGRTDEQLAQRFVDQPYLTRASTFNTVSDAERYTYANLEANQVALARFLASTQDSTTVSLRFNHRTGNTLVAGAGGSVDAFAVVTVVRKDATMPAGFRIVTSFPDL